MSGTIPVQGTITPNGPFPVSKGDIVINVYTNGTRPAANSVSSGYVIANSSTGTIQWSNGSSWLDLASAANIPYTPAVSANWPEGLPNRVSGAIDTLSGRENTLILAGGSGLILDFSTHRHIRLALSATATTVASFTPPQDGALVTLSVVQDGMGSRTVGSWPANLHFNNSTPPTLTATGNKRDTFQFVYDGPVSAMFQVGGSVNM